LRAYLSIFRLRFAVHLQYRAAAAAGFFTQLFFGFILVMVYHAFYASSTAAQPLTLAQAVTYTWLGQATFRMLPINGDTEVVTLIRSGNVAYELSRPLSLYFLWYSRLLAVRIVPTMLSGLPLLAVTYWLPGGLAWRMPPSLAAGAAWLLSMLLALLLGCAISNLMTISCLWTIAGDGMERILPAASGILSGMYVPLAYFPDWSRALLRVLPFSGLVDTPFRLYLGTVTAGDMLPLMLLQVFWTIILVLAGLVLVSRGLRKVVLQGG
jgi:ABC-2 type transport system permease protein